MYISIDDEIAGAHNDQGAGERTLKDIIENPPEIDKEMEDFIVNEEVRYFTKDLQCI